MLHYLPIVIRIQVDLPGKLQQLSMAYVWILLLNRIRFFWESWRSASSWVGIWLRILFIVVLLTNAIVFIWHRRTPAVMLHVAVTLKWLHVGIRCFIFYLFSFNCNCNCSLQQNTLSIWRELCTFCKQAHPICKLVCNLRKMIVLLCYVRRM